MCSSSSDIITEKFFMPAIGAHLAEWDVTYAGSGWKQPHVGGATTTVEGAIPNVEGATAIVGGSAGRR